MKRFLVLFAVLVPLSWFIAGCGGSGGSSSSKPTTEATPEKMQSMQEAMKREKMKMAEKAKGGGVPSGAAKQ